MNSGTKIIYPFLVFLTVFATDLSAHPHVFLDCDIDFIFDENGLAGIKHRWVFDEMYSVTFLQDFDLNGDGVLNNNELENIYQNAFIALKDYNYFNIIHINGKEFIIKKHSNFKALIVNNRLVYEFVVHCPIKASNKVNTIKVSILDETNYIAMDISDRSPIFSGKKNMFRIEHTKKDHHEWTGTGECIPSHITVKFTKI